MDTSALIPLLAALLGAGGILGSIAAYRKVQPEKDSIIITSAQGAVVVQSGVIEDLREELDRCHERIAAMDTELHAEVARLRDERNALREENRKLRARVRQLEERVDSLGGPLPT